MEMGHRDVYYSSQPPQLPQTHMQRTLLKSSLVALISFQVLFSSWMQMQKNSSKERSWVKNMGWKSWQFSLAVDTKERKVVTNSSAVTSE